MELQERIKELEEILNNDTQLRAVIKNELSEVREEHDTPCRSQIVFDEGDMEVEDLIDNEPVVITLSKGGYIKSVAADTFRTQGRGGRGVQGARLKEDDILVAGSHHYSPLLSPCSLLIRERFTGSRHTRSR